MDTKTETQLSNHCYWHKFSSNITWLKYIALDTCSHGKLSQSVTFLAQIWEVLKFGTLWYVSHYSNIRISLR